MSCSRRLQNELNGASSWSESRWSLWGPYSRVTDWASWGTAAGTLVLAGATFAAIRSSNRSARIAERSLLAGLRPLLVVARRDDPAQEIQFADGRVLESEPARPLFRHDDGVIYLAIPLRNAGTGVAHLEGYRLDPESADRVQSDPFGPARHRRGEPPPDPTTFAPQQRDLYIPPDDTGFWQAALRDPTDELYRASVDAQRTRGRVIVDILYGDLEDSQPAITRFVLLPGRDSTWRCDATHHWRHLPGHSSRS
jgi:hypothetical protein